CPGSPVRPCRPGLVHRAGGQRERALPGRPAAPRRLLHPAPWLASIWPEPAAGTGRAGGRVVAGRPAPRLACPGGLARLARAVADGRGHGGRAGLFRRAVLLWVQALRLYTTWQI